MVKHGSSVPEKSRHFKNHSYYVFDEPDHSNY